MESNLIFMRRLQFGMKKKKNISVNRLIYYVLLNPVNMHLSIVPSCNLGSFFFLGCSQDFTAMYVLFYFILLSDKLSAVHMFTYQAKCSPHVYISIFHEISSAQAIKPNNCQHN